MLLGLLGLVVPIQNVNQVFDPFGGFLAILCLFVVVSIIILILVAVWMYKDAQSRGMNGTLWVVILIIAGLVAGLIGGLIVIVIYLVVRGSHPVGGQPFGYPGYGYPPYPPPVAPPPTAPPPSTMAAGTATTCRSCGAPLPAGVAFCPNCGTKL